VKGGPLNAIRKIAPLSGEKDQSYAQNTPANDLSYYCAYAGRMRQREECGILARFHANLITIIN
jgi:hypothetical protein